MDNSTRNNTNIGRRSHTDMHIGKSKNNHTNKHRAKLMNTPTLNRWSVDSSTSSRKPRYITQHTHDHAALLTLPRQEKQQSQPHEQANTITMQRTTTRSLARAAPTNGTRTLSNIRRTTMVMPCTRTRAITRATTRARRREQHHYHEHAL